MASFDIEFSAAYDGLSDIYLSVKAQIFHPDSSGNPHSFWFFLFIFFHFTVP